MRDVGMKFLTQIKSSQNFFLKEKFFQLKACASVASVEQLPTGPSFE